MKIVIEANEDYKGDLVEYAPSGFKVVNQELRIMNQADRDAYGSEFRFSEETGDSEKRLIWQDIEIMKGDVLEISYIFDAPNISPELYLLGPMELYKMNGAEETGLPRRSAPRNDSFVFAEARKWQIASDAIKKRARTVQFLAGKYSGGGSTGKNSDTDQTFSTFNFRLAETGVDIKNAFIIFESQFEAYSNGANDYTGYNLAFDTCEESCTANAFSGTNRVLKDDNTVLAYDEIESNQVRLLFDVTEETQLAAYTGGGTDMEAQVGYRIEQGAAANSIANANAILVLTYTYDANSENITNTVVYPLDSTGSGDSGSGQSHQEGDCTFGTDCPQFDYNMEIPEFPGYATSTYRLSQWFSYNEVNDNHSGTDVQISSQLVGESTPSSVYYHESALSGTQGNIPIIYFDSLTGYSENTAQSIEYRSYTNSTAHDHAIQGGEVFETYIASSSATTSTKTITLPLGVVFNGLTDNSGYKSVNVYFPENGQATGTVDIKSAWFRIINHDHLSAVESVTVASKVGSNATSSDFTYEYNTGGSVKSPLFKIFQIIESSNYAELENAHATSSIKVGLSVSNLDVHAGVTSAELVITYAYTSESNGYLTNIQLYGGQSEVAPTTATTTATANSVMPESAGKTIRGATLWASFLNSDSGGDVGAGTVFDLDANLAIGSPSCSATYSAEPDDINSYTEFYKDVTSAMNTTDNQAYNACYADDESLTATDGAKMNGILSYTYQYDNQAPTSTLVSSAFRIDGSGVVDITIEVSDPDQNDCQAKLEYATGTACVFSSPGDPALDESDVNVTADNGDPDIENDNVYQIGTPGAYIETDTEPNRVYFDWLSGSDLKNVEGDYCLQLTVNDTKKDQVTPATTTVYIDTLAPTAPGALSFNTRTGTNMTLNYGATSTETNFNEYKIFYKIYDSTDPDEGDSVWASTSDANLDDQFFNDEATTTITGLSASTTYSFAIWAYDDYGNRASSSRVDITTNDAPTSVFNEIDTKQKLDGSGIVDISLEFDDYNNQDTLKARVEFATGTACDFSSSGDPTIDTGNVTADWGSPDIDNDNTYQIGTSSGWIKTSPGSNTVTFDWLTKAALPAADDTYCLRITANDRFDDQLVPATTTVTLDNIDPTTPGNFLSGEVTINSIELWYATTTPSTDTNEPGTDAYRVYYKQGTSAVNENHTEHDNSDLDAYDYGSGTSTIISGLDANTWYVFNIWSYDAFGNKATATEIAIKTNSTLSNNSLSFVNPQTEGADTNIALAGTTTENIFRAVVTETNGWYAIGSTTLRLANNNDSTAPYQDLEFYWDQTSDTFYEIGSDANSAVVLSANSTSTCAVNTCTLDFMLLFNKTFASTSIDYSAELYSTNDSGTTDYDLYVDIYQVRFPYIEQAHYRWRYDDGGE